MLCFGIDFRKIEFIFDGSKIDFSKIKTNFWKSDIFFQAWILTKSDELQKNFYNEKALEIYQLLPCNRTKPKDEQPFIKHGLMMLHTGMKTSYLELSESYFIRFAYQLRLRFLFIKSKREQCK